MPVTALRLAPTEHINPENAEKKTYRTDEEKKNEGHDDIGINCAEKVAKNQPVAV
jgi:hypothetical protein